MESKAKICQILLKETNITQVIMASLDSCTHTKPLSMSPLLPSDKDNLQSTQLRQVQNFPENNNRMSHKPTT